MSRRTIALLTAVPVAALLVGLGVYAAIIAPALPDIRHDEPELSLASVVLAADGPEIARYYRQDRIHVDLADISPHVIGALLAVEDHRFYYHEGVDVRRLLAAAYHTARGDIQGASTLSMQLARNLFPDEIGSARSAMRKVKEMITAVRLERGYAKHEILEMYLNTVPFGNNAFGIEAAARRYFGTSAERLSVPQSAMLIGLLKGTSYHDPLRHPQRAMLRRNLVLERMHRHGSITEEELGDYRGSPLALSVTRGQPAGTIAPHFAEHVRNLAAAWAEANGHDFYRDGLRVHTTLDTRLQEMAVSAVETQLNALQDVAAVEWSRRDFFRSTHLPAYRARLSSRSDSAFAYLWQRHPEILDAHIRRSARFRERTSVIRYDAALADLRSDTAFTDSLRRSITRLQGALVAVDPETGHVRAWVGGRRFEHDQYDKVAQARRQTGSAFKPFVYAAAIDNGISPHASFRDTLVTVSLSGSTRTWTPNNAGGGASGAEVSLRDALIYSKNTIATLLANEVGPHRVASYARRLGIESRLDAVPSIGLGTSEASLLEMTMAYATLSARGLRHAPLVITRIEDRDGRVLARFAPEAERAVSSNTAYAVLDMMRGVVSHGTGSGLRGEFGIDVDVAGKTGTTQRHADGWFIAMHPRLVVGSWVGFNDRRVSFRSEWGEGGRSALRLVGCFLAGVLDADPALRRYRFEPPPGYETSGRSEHAVAVHEPVLFRDALSEGLERRKASRPAPQERTAERGE
ncbi:MAG: penicillin-binding protein 1A [Bacteroidota bacterium]